MSIENTEQRAQRHPALDGLVHLTYVDSSFRSDLREFTMTEEEKELRKVQFENQERIYRLWEEQRKETEERKKIWQSNTLVLGQAEGILWSEKPNINTKIRNVVVNAAFVHNLQSLEQFKMLYDDEILDVNGVGPATLKAIRVRFPYQWDL